MKAISASLNRADRRYIQGKVANLQKHTQNRCGKLQASKASLKRPRNNNTTTSTLTTTHRGSQRRQKIYSTVEQRARKINEFIYFLFVKLCLFTPALQNDPLLYSLLLVIGVNGSRNRMCLNRGASVRLHVYERECVFVGRSASIVRKVCGALKDAKQKQLSEGWEKAS